MDIGQGHFATLDGHTIVYSGRLTQGMSGGAVWIHRKIARALVGYEPISDLVLVVRLKVKPRNIILIQVYGPTIAATDEEMERFYQDLSQAVKQVLKGDILLVMGDFNAKVGRREPSAVSSAVGLYGLGKTNEAGEQLEDFCLEHELALANTMFKQRPRRLYICTSPDGNTRNQIDYISIAQRWKTGLMNCRTYPGADCDTEHQLLMATLKVRLGKRHRQHSIPPPNLEELKEDKAVQFAAEVTNRFTALEAAQKLQCRKGIRPVKN